MDELEVSNPLKVLNYLSTAMLLAVSIFSFIHLYWPQSTFAYICGRPAAFLLGSYCLVSALRDWRRRIYVRQYGTEVTGEVKEIKRTGRWLYPVVEFCLPDNSKRTVLLKQNVNFDWHIVNPIGSTKQNITLRYNLSNPSEAFIYSSISIWLGPLMGILGGICIILTIFIS